MNVICQSVMSVREQLVTSRPPPASVKSLDSVSS